MVKADMFLGVAKNGTDMGLSRQTSGCFFLQTMEEEQMLGFPGRKKTNFT